MSGPRRRVRATPDFFYQIDQELPAERDDSGRPTRAEFEAYELMKVIDRFETGWDDLVPLFLGSGLLGHRAKRRTEPWS